MTQFTKTAVAEAIATHNTYWNDKGLFQNEYNSIKNETLSEDNTVALSSVGRIYYQINNDGLGWNDISSAIEVLSVFNHKYGIGLEEDLNRLQELYDLSQKESEYDDDGEEIEDDENYIDSEEVKVLTESIANHVIHFIFNNQ